MRLNLAAIAGGWAFAVLTYAHLPERFPAHWNLAGEVDRWANKSWAEWLLLPIIGTILALLMLWLAVKLPKIPASLINVPDKERFMELRAEQRAPVIALLMQMLLLLTALQTVIFVGIHWAMYKTALGESPSIAWAAMGVLGVVYFAVLVRYIRSTKTAVRDALTR